MRLLLIHPKFPYRGKDLFPIGLGYLAAVARDIADVFVLDENVEEFEIEKIKKMAPDIVGITATTPSFPRAAEIIEKVKSATDAKVVVGGTHATFRPEDMLGAGADVVVRGEGEITFLELLNDWNLEKTKGISYRKNGEIAHNPDRELIENLDEIPFPAHECFPLKKYGIMSITTSRGCPYACSYCNATKFWKHRVRFRSPENVLQELKKIISLGFNSIRFVDSTFTLDKARAMKICEMIKNENIRWSCETRCDALDDEMLKALADSGCILLCLGVDSGAQKILDINKRCTDVSVMKEIFKKAHEYGIATRAYVTFGLPGENEKTVKETLSFLDEAKPSQCLLSLATAYPSTELDSGRFVEVHPAWLARFRGHGLGGKLYLPEGMSKKEYMRLAEEIWEEVRKMNRIKGQEA